MAPMNNRLMRPRASGSVITDADARAYVAKVEAADGQKLERAVAIAINDFVLGCKADGSFSKLKACCLLMGARTLSGALTPLVGTAPTNTNFVSADYNRKTGLVGNGTNKTLDTNRANNADPQNDNHVAIYLSTGGSGNQGYLSSGANPTGQNTMFAQPPFTVFRNRSGSGSSGTFGTLSGFMGMSRSSSASYVIRHSGADSTATVASQTPNSASIALYTLPDFAGYVSAARFAFYSIGEAITLSALESRVTTLYNAIGAASL